MLQKINANIANSMSDFGRPPYQKKREKRKKYIFLGLLGLGALSMATFGN